MGILSLKSLDNSGLAITSFGRRAQHGCHSRAWKSMEELPLRSSGAWNEWRRSLLSSPTYSLELGAASIFSTVGRVEAKTGQGIELREISTLSSPPGQIEGCEELFSKIMDEEQDAPFLAHGACVSEFAPPLKSPDSQVRPTPCDEQHILQQHVDIEVATHTIESSKETNCAEKTAQMEQVDIEVATDTIESSKETNCLEKTVWMEQVMDLQEAPLLSHGARVSELAPPVKSPDSQVRPTPCDKQHTLPQHVDIEVATHTTESSKETNCVEKTAQMEQVDIEVATHTIESSKETNDIEKTVQMEQVISSVQPTCVDCKQHEDVESQEISAFIPQGLDGNDGLVNTEACSQMSTNAKGMEDIEHISEDNELVSQVNNIDCQESHSLVSTPPKRADNGKHSTQMEDTSVHSTSPEVSLHEHLRQVHIAREDISAQNFIMHRFLPAAQEIAAMEHESFKALLARRNQAAAACPSPSKPRRPPIAHRIKTRAHQAPKGFTTTIPMHAKQQDDGIPLSMKSCGFFCLGLKNSLFRAHRSGTASRKTSWASHLASHVKVSDTDSSSIGSKHKEKTGAMEGLPNVNHWYSPSRTSAKFHEIPGRHATKCHANFSTEGGSSVECSPLYSQLNAAGHVDVNPQLDVAGTKLKRQEESVVEGMATPNFVSPCSYHHAQSGLPMHDGVKANMRGIPLQVSIGGMEAISCPPERNRASQVGDGDAKSCPEQEQAGQYGDGDAKSCIERDQAWQDGTSNEDGESPFFDALSRLNSIKSTASFYTFGSPNSQFENVGLQNEWGMKDESGFTDAVSEFETPRASFSENKSVLAHSAGLERGIYANSEPSSLSRRFGKALKVETCDHVCIPSSSDHSGPSCKYPYFEDKIMLQAGDWQVESFPRSLDSKYPLSPATASPIFPAKCQSGSTLGWPFGISSYQSSGSERSPDDIHPEKSIKEYVTGFHVPSPPLPPSPKGSWLGKAMMRNASNTSPLATLQQKSKVASARKKLDFLVADDNAERRWEDVVKGSQVQTGHLRFSEELHHQHHPLNNNAIQPLKL